MCSHKIHTVYNYGAIKSIRHSKRLNLEEDCAFDKQKVNPQKKSFEQSQPVRTAQVNMS